MNDETREQTEPCNATGFWSYVHADDDAEGGRITDLARDLVSQYELLTGQRIALFLDRDALKWGEVWRDRVDESIEAAAFFVAVLTPRFFMSAECRREFQVFSRHATQLGVKDLVLPLYYAEVPGLCSGEADDDLFAVIRAFQCEDWRELRFADVGSGDYRRGVACLAARIAEANTVAEGERLAGRHADQDAQGEVESDGAPGFLDRLASSEEAWPKWIENMKGITEEIQRIAEIMSCGTRDIERGNAMGSGFAARLRVARRMAGELADPAERMLVYGNEFASLVHEVDDGIRLIITQGADEAREDAGSRSALCRFFATLSTLSSASHEAIEGAQRMVDSLAPIEKSARDLRPPIRRLRQGLTSMIEAGRVTDEWIQLIDSVEVECKGT